MYFKGIRNRKLCTFMKCIRCNMLFYDDLSHLPKEIKTYPKILSCYSSTLYVRRGVKNVDQFYLNKYDQCPVMVSRFLLRLLVSVFWWVVSFRKLRHNGYCGLIYFLSFPQNLLQFGHLLIFLLLYFFRYSCQGVLLFHWSRDFTHSW